MSDAIEGPDGEVLGYECPECGTMKTSAEKAGQHCADEARDVYACFTAAIEAFNECVDEETDRGESAREYYHRRGWDDDVIEAYQLGWAAPEPYGETILFDHLEARGFDHDTIRATGLFNTNDHPLWQGRYVIPYTDESGRPVYAIARCTGSDGGGAAGYDGHPDDYLAGKYAKVAHSREDVPLEEPIFGLDSVRDGEPLLVAGGIADAITLQQAGYPCISPVTTVRFKGDHQQDVIELVEDRDIPTVYLVNDNERPSIEVTGDGDGAETLTIKQLGEGLRGAFDTADFMLDAGIGVRLVTLPNAGGSLRKVDPDDFIRDNWGSVDQLLHTAIRPEHHPDYDYDTRSSDASANVTTDEVTRPSSGAPVDHTPSPSDAGSALFDLDITDVTGKSVGYRGTNPLGHHGESEDYFVVVDRDGARDHKYGVSYNALLYLACEADVRNASAPSGSFSIEELRETWEHAKTRGYIPTDDPIPRSVMIGIALGEDLCERGGIEDGWKLPVNAYNEVLDRISAAGVDPGRQYLTEPGDPAGTVAMLPDTGVDHLDTLGSWDWQNADTAGSIDLQTARDRTEDAIIDALERGDRALIDALPTTGKTTGTVLAAKETGEPITICTTRGREEQYGAIEDLAEAHGLRAKVLPSFTEDCPTMRGDHGDTWESRFEQLYYAGGWTGQEIHQHAERAFGETPPCQEHGNCPNTNLWDFEAAGYDILIGHYTHAHNHGVTEKRTLVFDEFVGDAYETTFSGNLERVVSAFLAKHDGIPFEDYTDLIENRDDTERRDRAIRWFNSEGIERDIDLAIDERGGHADAPAATYTLLAGQDLGNGFEAVTPDTSSEDFALAAEYNRADGTVTIYRSPNLRYTRGVVCLDGTPTRDLWDTALGVQLNYRQVLTDEERAEYLTEALDHHYIKTTEYVNTHSVTTDDSINTRKEAALLAEIADRHGEKPDAITSMKAETEVWPGSEDAPLDHVDRTEHFGNVLGSNQFKHSRLGAVVGCSNFGDGFVKKWGARAGYTVTSPERDFATGAGYGHLCEFGGDGAAAAFGNELLAHFREQHTLQRMLRFGRDGNGATVYVHTDTIPDWVPIAGEGRVRTAWCDGMLAVMTAIEELRSASTTEIAAHPAVDICERQVRTHLHTLARRGDVTLKMDGRGYVWTDDGVTSINEHGDVSLPDGGVALDELSAEQVAEVCPIATTIGETSGTSGNGEPQDTPPHVARSIEDDPPPRSVSSGD